MAQTIKMSLDAKLYRGAAGSPNPGTLVDSCKDVSLKITVSEAKVSNRTCYWGLSLAALLEGSFDVEFNADSADPHLGAFQSACFGRTNIRCWIKDAASGQGLDADFAVLGLDDTQKLEDVVQYKFTLKPSTSGYGQTVPTWH
jgi:hypothetical protein